MQFHSAPVTELTSVPEFGMHRLIRSKIASIRTFGAHVFRVVAPETRPPSSRMPKRHTGDELRVRVQTFPEYPTIVSDAFFGRPAADSSVKRKELRARLPSEREKRLSATELNRKGSESAASLRAEYKDFGVKRFLSSVNDPSVTWVRQVAATRNEKMVMGSEPRPIDVHYVRHNAKWGGYRKLTHRQFMAAGSVHVLVEDRAIFLQVIVCHQQLRPTESGRSDQESTCVTKR